MYPFSILFGVDNLNRGLFKPKKERVVEGGSMLKMCTRDCITFIVMCAHALSHRATQYLLEAERLLPVLKHSDTRVLSREAQYW